MATDAPFLVVAGVRDESSLGWAAASAWLRRDPAHRVVLTTRSDRAAAFAADQGRVETVRVDWTDEGAPAALAEHLGDRRVAGAVHAVAGADAANFTTPAHDLDGAVYVGAYDATTVSLFRLVQGCRANLAPGAGIVTLGFGEFGTVSEEYGGAMTVAKLALAQAVAVLGVSLGPESVRTLEIVTGFIPTYAGRGVAVGMGRAAGRRVPAAELAATFAGQAPLDTDADGQREAAGELAVSFVSDPMFRHTTGERIHVDGGWSLRSKSMIPA